MECAASRYASEMSDDEIIQQRINGSSVRAIARTHGCAVTEVNAVMDRFADATVDDKTRKHSLAVELARLDQLQKTFYAQALDGDVASGALCVREWDRAVYGSPNRLDAMVWGLTRLSKVIIQIPIA